MQILLTIFMALILFGYVLLLARKKSTILSIGLIFVVEIVWLFISATYIDGGTYISEQGRVSYFTGASIRLFLIYLPFLLLLPYFTKKDGQKIQVYADVPLTTVKVKSSWVYSLAQIALFCVVSYGLLDMFLTGIPLFSNTVTRSNFFTFSKLPGSSLLMGEVTFFLMFLNGKLFSETTDKKRKWLCLVLLAYSFAHRFLMSYKYDGLYQIFFMFFLYSLYKWLKRTSLKKIFSWKNILIVFSLLVCFLLFIYLFYDLKHNAKNPFQLLLARLFSLQSHTWWGEDLRHIRNNDYWFNWEQITKEFLVLFKPNTVYDKETGIVNVMYHVTHFSVVESYLGEHLRFYGNFATVALNCFGYLGTAIWGVLVAKTIAYSIANFEAAMKRDQWVLCYVSLSFLLDVFEYFRIGNFSYVFNVKTLLMLTVLIVSNCLRKYKYKKIPLLKMQRTFEAFDYKSIPETVKISLCMCTYNGEQYIREQLDSIVNQTKLPSEIIVFDDASTDGTVAILNEYKTAYPQIRWDIRVNEKNAGWRVNFKNCLQQASGDVIFLADQDDIWMSDKLAVMTRALLQNPEIEVLVSDYTPFYMDGSIDHGIEVETEGTKTVSPLPAGKNFLHCARPGCTFALKKEALVDFFVCWQPHFAHDAILWRITALKGTLYRIDYSSILFRRHSSNASSNKNRRISAAERTSEQKVLYLYRDCIEALRALPLSTKSAATLAKVSKWNEKRIALYEKPSIWKWIALCVNVGYYPWFKAYLKDLNSLFYKG